MENTTARRTNGQLHVITDESSNAEWKKSDKSSTHYATVFI